VKKDAKGVSYLGRLREGRTRSNISYMTSCSLTGEKKIGGGRKEIAFLFYPFLRGAHSAAVALDRLTGRGKGTSKETRRKRGKSMLLPLIYRSAKKMPFPSYSSFSCTSPESG